jgi:hypothetical protein
MDGIHYKLKYTGKSKNAKGMVVLLSHRDENDCPYHPYVISDPVLTARISTVVATYWKDGLVHTGT